MSKQAEPTGSGARNPSFRAVTQDQVEAINQRTWYHSIELPDGTVMPGVIPLEMLRQRIQSFPIPMDLRGRRVLDVGAATGWCSFEMERRGAAVVAVDCVEYEEFHEARRLLGSGVEYRVLDMEEIRPELLGRFDYVLFFGVLYHLRHPLLGLERICALTTDTAFVESFVVNSERLHDATEIPALEFYETDDLGGQIDNWYGPNIPCLLAFCRSAGFASVSLEYCRERRAGVTCRRRAEEPVHDPSDEAPWVNSAVNNRLGDRHFHREKDEYICLYFNTKVEGLTRDQVHVAVDDYAVPVLTLTHLGRKGWQANLKVPPGLDAGRHEIRLRTTHSEFSQSFTIEMLDAPRLKAAADDTPFVPEDQASAPAPELYEVENSMDESATFRGYRKELLSCRFRSSETDLAKNQIRVEVGGQIAPNDFLTHYWDGGWQINTRLPTGLDAGRHLVRVRTQHSPYSSPLTIDLVF